MDAHLSRINLRTFRFADWRNRVYGYSGISRRELRAWYRDINTRDRFQVHLGVLGVTAHQNPAEMSVAPSGKLLCMPQAPLCRPVCRRIPPLLRTWAFCEGQSGLMKLKLKIQRKRARGVRGVSINQCLRLKQLSLCALRDFLRRTMYYCGLCLIELAQKSNSALLWLFVSTMSNGHRRNMRTEQN